MKRVAEAVRPLAYLWASPYTALGLLVGAVGYLTGGRLRVRDGVIEAWGGILRPLLQRCVPFPGGAMAITLGHVVVGRSDDALALTRSHERVHVRQYERWGPLFLPAYLAGSAWGLVRRRGVYRGNPFERQAFRDAPPSACEEDVI